MKKKIVPGEISLSKSLGNDPVDHKNIIVLTENIETFDRNTQVNISQNVVNALVRLLSFSGTTVVNGLVRLLNFSGAT